MFFFGVIWIIIFIFLDFLVGQGFRSYLIFFLQCLSFFCDVLVSWLLVFVGFRLEMGNLIFRGDVFYFQKVLIVRKFFIF